MDGFGLRNPGFVGILGRGEILDLLTPADVYGAYSVARRLSSTYSGALFRIREDGSGTETDIGTLADGTVDIPAIIAHCGASDGFVTRLYEQSGNGEDLVAPSASTQPFIYDSFSGDVTRTFTDNLPAMFLDGIDDWMQTAIDASLTQPISWFITFSPPLWLTAAVLVDARTGAFTMIQQDANPAPVSDDMRIYFSVDGTVQTNFNPDGNLHLCSAVLNGASSSIQDNDGTKVTGNPGTQINMGGITLGAHFNGTGVRNDWQISDILCLKVAAGASDYDLIRNYFNTKYSLW